MSVFGKVWNVIFEKQLKISCSTINIIYSFHDFGHIHPYVQCKLFKQYCYSFYGELLWLLSSQGVSNAFIAWRKALRKIWKLSPMTHYDVESKPLEVSLRQRSCKFSTGIDKYGSDVLETVFNVARSNPFSVYCNNYVEISGMYDNDRNVCYNMIMNNLCNSTSGGLRSNVSVLRDVIDIRDGVKECDSLCIDDVLFIIDDICIN